MERAHVTHVATIIIENSGMHMNQRDVALDDKSGRDTHAVVIKEQLLPW